jgi:hypothetical protein
MVLVQAVARAILGRFLVEHSEPAWYDSSKDSGQEMGDEASKQPRSRFTAAEAQVAAGYRG